MNTGPVPTRVALRAARTARGWSQADAAQALAALGRARSVPTATVASLKTHLSRWENGHAVPEAPYRRLLAELFETDETGLGLGEPETGPAGTAGEADDLVARLAEASALDEGALQVLREQLVLAARLDRRLGAAGSEELLGALTGTLSRLHEHVLATPLRRAVGGLLAECALLAGEVAAERGRWAQAWAAHGRAGDAARAAGLPALAAQAQAFRGRTLIAAGRPDDALTLLVAEPGLWAVLVRGTAFAAKGEASACRDTFAAAAAYDPRTDGLAEEDERAVGTLVAGPATVARARTRAMAALGEPDAITAARQAFDDEALPVRERAWAGAAAALGLERQGHRPEAEEQRRTTLMLALRIGADALAVRLTPDAVPRDRARQEPGAPP